MKIAFIGAYAPRQCGIGSFIQHLFESIKDLYGLWCIP